MHCGSRCLKETFGRGNGVPSDLWHCIFFFVILVLVWLRTVTIQWLRCVCLGLRKRLSRRVPGPLHGRAWLYLACDRYIHHTIKPEKYRSHRKVALETGRDEKYPCLVEALPESTRDETCRILKTCEWSLWVQMCPIGTASFWSVQCVNPS